MALPGQETPNQRAFINACLGASAALQQQAQQQQFQTDMDRQLGALNNTLWMQQFQTDMNRQKMPDPFPTPLTVQTPPPPVKVIPVPSSPYVY
jgi:hypothetical protein